MSDLQYLAVKEFEGKVVKNNGTVTSTGTLAILTAAGGKDLYIAKAKISARSTSTGIILEIGLSVDGITVELFTFITTSNNLSTDYDFIIKGLKVLPTKNIQLVVNTNTSNNFNVKGVIEGWEEDTGTSPQIPPLEPV